MLPRSLFVYAVAPYSWRWEIRRGGALPRCGTARSKVAAIVDVDIAANT